MTRDDSSPKFSLSNSIWNFIRRTLIGIRAVDNEAEWNQVRISIASQIPLRLISTLISVIGVALVAVWLYLPVLQTTIYPPHIARSPKNAGLSILVAQLEGDHDNSQTELLLTALRRQFAQANEIHNVYIKESEIPFNFHRSGDVFKDQQTFEDRAQKWLKQGDFDLFISGKLPLKKSSALQIFLVVRSDLSGITDHTKDTSPISLDKNYPLTRRLDLPVEFQDDVGEIVFGVAARLLGQNFSDPRTIKQELKALRHLLIILSRQEHPKQWATTKADIGTALFSLAQQKKELNILEQAVGMLQDASNGFSRNWNVNTWAWIKYQLCLTLQSLGRRQSRIATFERAETACKDALTVYSHDNDSYERLRALYELGAARFDIGELQADDSQLHKAIDTFKKAAAGNYGNEQPAWWFVTHYGIAIAQLRIGEHESNIAMVENSERTLVDGAKTISANQNPADWAMFQNLHAIMLTEIGEATNKFKKVEMAIAEARDAIKIAEKQRDIYSRAHFQTTLGYALHKLGAHEIKSGARESGAKHLQDSIAAFEAAIHTRSLDSQPTRRAITQRQYGNALRTVGVLNHDPALISKALLNLRAALQLFKKVDYKFEISVTETDIAKAESMLQQESHNNINK